jgi:hypothetical protein
MFSVISPRESLTEFLPTIRSGAMGFTDALTDGATRLGDTASGAAANKAPRAGSADTARQIAVPDRLPPKAEGPRSKSRLPAQTAGT